MDINRQIMAELTKDARQSFQEIGKKLHLSGQAVSARVKKLEEEKQIIGYTIKRNDLETAYITVFMQSTAYTAFEEELSRQESVEQLAKITGEGCYLIIYRYESVNQLEDFLQTLLRYGRYRINTAVRKIK
ncbi:Lrp/AsnC family transcriptional regulator [Listeria costaricensis]|uniref:Lrp/AsnC family transcriptional regulator n=1 Tax=Listeria costaricensis TaxID=2026604 RepID=UPI000C0718D0|nr:AsnC family transcriptional regulator [Listeria costaricensis]